MNRLTSIRAVCETKKVPIVNNFFRTSKIARISPIPQKKLETVLLVQQCPISGESINRLKSISPSSFFFFNISSPFFLDQKKQYSTEFVLLPKQRDLNACMSCVLSFSCLSLCLLLCLLERFFLLSSSLLFPIHLLFLVTVTKNR